MASFTQSQSLYTPAQIAARTALANAGIGKSNMDQNTLNLCEAFCLGVATFFGVPQTEQKSRDAIIRMLAAFGINAEVMEAHYFDLIDLMEEN
jgi:hypothetical protein